MLENPVGKGDRRTRRGKIYAGSFGKSRPKAPKGAKAKVAARPAVKAAPAAKPAAKAPARKKSA
jgi:30S ribosomal protein S31